MADTHTHNQFSNAETVDYSKCKIVNIRRGPKVRNRQHIIYARLVDEHGNMLINADLDYIVNALADRLPKEA